jgi:pimeloyl-ACP methyl ester carboxylesterase
MGYHVGMVKILVMTVSVLLGTWVGLGSLLYFMQRSFLYFPTPVGGVRVPSLLTMSVGGVSLKVCCKPEEGDKALIYFGGNAEDVSYSLADFANAFPDHALYMPHYRGYSGSGGNPTEKDLLGDAQALLDMVSQKHQKITIVGRSLGTGIAVWLASNKQNVERLVLITPYDSILNLACQKFPFLLVRWLLKDRYDSIQWASRVSCPTKILAADRDEIIPMQSTLNLFKAFAPGVATMDVIQGTNHNSISESPAFVKALSVFH